MHYVLVKRPALPDPGCCQLHCPDLCGVVALTSRYSVHDCDRQAFLGCISSLAHGATHHAVQTRRRGTLTADWRTSKSHGRTQGSEDNLDDLYTLKTNS